MDISDVSQFPGSSLFCVGGMHNRWVSWFGGLANRVVREAVDEVRRTEAKHNDWIKGTRYLWLKNLQNLDAEEKASIVRLEAANLDTMQAWQIRMNLQDVFTMPSVA